MNHEACSWRCGKCGKEYRAIAEADDCCLPEVVRWQIWSSSAGAKVFINEIVNGWVHCFELPLGLKLSMSVRTFVEKYHILVKG